MKKKHIFSILIILIGLNSFGQKGHRIAFVDMNYILENIPDYQKAQSQLNSKVQKWQQDLNKIQSEIETMRTNLSNEKILLTNDLIAEKEEDIEIKEGELKALEDKYFSPNGNLFLLRKQLVTPIQDQVYNATQEIAKARRYDFVFDKSSDLIMLYSTKQNDISELVLRSIVRGEKASKANEKRAVRARQTSTSTKSASNVKNVESTASEMESTSDLELDSTTDIDPKQAAIDEREAKRQAALLRNEQIREERLKKREEQKAAIEKKRLDRLKKREEAKNGTTTKENNKEDSIEEEKENE